MPTATDKANIANSLYCGPPRVRELVLLMARVRNSGIYFSQTFVIFLCRGFSCCPYYRGVCNSEVSARRELTVFGSTMGTREWCSFGGSLGESDLVKRGSLLPG